MTAKDNAIVLADWLLNKAVEEQPTGTSEDYEARGNDEYLFEECAQDWGFSLLGVGFFAAVFSHKDAPGYAIKVCLREGDSSPAYLAWARANPGPHVPRVHHLKRRGQYVVAVLDRLLPMDSAAVDVFEEHLDRDLSKVTDHPVSAVAQRIRKFFDGACNFDLHHANCMMDRNYQLVLTDPVSFSDSEKSRALRTGIERAYNIADEQSQQYQ